MTTFKDIRKAAGIPEDHDDVCLCVTCMHRALFFTKAALDPVYSERAPELQPGMRIVIHWSPTWYDYWDIVERDGATLTLKGIPMGGWEPRRLQLMIRANGGVYMHGGTKPLTIDVYER